MNILKFKQKTKIERPSAANGHSWPRTSMNKVENFKIITFLVSCRNADVRLEIAAVFNPYSCCKLAAVCSHGMQEASRMYLRIWRSSDSRPFQMNNMFRQIIELL